MKWQRNLIAFIITLTLLYSCDKDDAEICEPNAPSAPTLNLPDEPYNYEDLNLPEHIANNTQLAVYASNNTPPNNYRTNEGAALGRVLFYDTRLSEDNSISCGSCHFQENAFSNDEMFSTGINGQVTSRSSMSLLNMRYFRDFFWDMRADGLEAQVLLPIENEIEMGAVLDELVIELAQIPEYVPLFEAAFGDAEITADRISRAMSQFLRSMVTFNSKYDQGVATDFANFTELELAGKDLFFSGDVRCNNCHSSYNFFTRLEPSMNGLELEEWDTGFYEKTGDPEHIGQFKIVSLRNIEVTAPYMHDGRFQTLEEVIEHYNSGVFAHPNLDERLTVEFEKGGTPITFNMTQYEKDALVAFLKTLTDETVLTDPRFADPFEY